MLVILLFLRWSSSRSVWAMGRLCRVTAISRLFSSAWAMASSSNVGVGLPSTIRSCSRCELASRGPGSEGTVQG